MLDVQTGKGDRANDLVVRVKHDLLDRSYIGAIGTQRIAHKREVGSSTLPRPIRVRPAVAVPTAGF